MKYISILIVMTMVGCASFAPPPSTKQCCERLDVRTKEMNEFNRYCMMLVFAARKEDRASVLEDIKQRIGLCKFVFGVETDESLISSAAAGQLYLTVQEYKVEPQQIFRDFDEID